MPWMKKRYENASVERNYENEPLSISFEYIVSGVEDESSAIDYVHANIPRKHENIPLQNVTCDEQLDTSIFVVSVTYAEDNPNVGASGDEKYSYGFSFETGGGTKKVIVPRKTIAVWPSGSLYPGAVNVDNAGNVNGVDIVSPVMNFMETHTLKASKVTESYKKKIAMMTGSVNADTFRSYEPGEVLFLGASGSRRGKDRSDYWEITFRFSVSPNIVDETIPNFPPKITKRGWDYLWFQFSPEIQTDADGKKIRIRVPKAAYIDQVYPYKDFKDLEI